MTKGTGIPPFDPEVLKRIQETFEGLERSGALAKIQQMAEVVQRTVALERLQHFAELVQQHDFQHQLDRFQETLATSGQLQLDLPAMQRLQESIPPNIVDTAMAIQASAAGAALPPTAVGLRIADPESDELRRRIRELEQRVAELEHRPE